MSAKSWREEGAGAQQMAVSSPAPSLNWPLQKGPCLPRTLTPRKHTHSVHLLFGKWQCGLDSFAARDGNASVTTPHTTDHHVQSLSALALSLDGSSSSPYTHTYTLTVSTHK